MQQCLGTAVKLWGFCFCFLWFGFFGGLFFFGLFFFGRAGGGDLKQK